LATWRTVASSPSAWGVIREPCRYREIGASRSTCPASTKRMSAVAVIGLVIDASE
jgi:hypothetical protein